MAHDLLHERMAFVGEVPWHGLGKQVPPEVSSAEMIKAAGLDWRVAKRPAPGARLVDKRKEKYDRYAIWRDPTGEEKGAALLGLVGASYTPVQNEAAFEFFEPFIDLRLARFETAGALGNGERIWVLAKLKGIIVVGADDVVDKYLLLSNSHDGKGAITIRFTPIRVVCRNTLTMALKDGNSAIKVSHRPNVEKRLLAEEAKTLHKLIDVEFDRAQAIFHQLAQKRISEQIIQLYFGKLHPRESGSSTGKAEPERWQRIRTVLEDGRITPSATRGTMWALYNAAVREEDYRVTREGDADRRLERVWFGAGASLKLRALEIATELAGLSKAA